MRYKHLLSEQQLDELRMSPSSLRQFATSPEAQGIMAGFEAELVFTGLGGEGDYDQDPEPDYDADERCHSIDGVVDFFENDEYGWGLSPRGARELRDNLDEKYMEWYDEQLFDQWRDERDERVFEYIENNEWDWEDAIRECMEDMGLSDEEIDRAEQFLSKNTRERDQLLADQPELTDAYEHYKEAREAADEKLNDRVAECIDAEDGTYDAALEEFRNDFYIDDDSGFWTDTGLRWMSSVAEEFSLDWPIMQYTGRSSDGGFSLDNAERLADDLHEKLGVQTRASDGYHSAIRKPGVWILEPDSSLDSDDADNMAVEIVSPPMPLEECLAKMEQFFEWAESNGAYSNSSTGLHMGVSLPHRGGNVDYLKLALFLGDEHVLNQFGRIANHFCEAAMKKIRRAIKGGEKVTDALELMRHNLIELAAKQLQISPGGYGKYTSINPKGGEYIEFRSAGGSNYFEDIDRLKNTLLRYAKAMTVAADPAAERREYYKKLYKLIAPSTGDASMDLFSRFATGSISAEELKKSWAEAALSKEVPDYGKKSTWVLFDKSTGKTVVGHQYSGYTYDDALARAKEKISPGSSVEGFKKQYDLIDTETNTGRWSIVDRDTGETLEVVDAATKGEAADQVYDKYTKDSKGFFVRPYVDFEQSPKLSRRGELAKRIKQGPKDKEAKELARLHKELGLSPDDNKAYDWEAVYTPTGRVVDTLSHADIEQANTWRNDVVRRHDFPNPDAIEIRRAGDERYSNYADAQRAADQQNRQNNAPRSNVEFYVHDDPSRVVHTMHDATFQDMTDYIEQQERNGMPPGFLRVRPIGDHRPTVAEPNQVRMPNGVLVWELFDRDTNHAIHTIADHTMREAHNQAMSWLRSVGAEDPNTWNERFGVRPKMLAPGEQNTAGEHTPPTSGSRADNTDPATYNGRWEVLNPAGTVIRHVEGDRNDAETARQQFTHLFPDPNSVTIRPAPLQTESRKAKKAFADFDAYFENMIAPARKKLA